MKKLLTTLLLLYTTLFAKEAILKLDTKGHTAKIQDIIVTKSGDIISASDDKTIRIWDSRSGREKRKILGQIGAGSEGKIFAIALSPNEEFLAVGGYLTGTRESGERYAIRIYNYQTGELLKVLKSHTNVINDLAFSSDGKYLISGSGDFTAKIWSGKTFKLIDTINTHTKQVYAVKIIKKANRYFAVTAGYDNKIALYDLQTKEIKSDRKSYKLQYLAVSKNHIAVCGFGKEIQIYDYSLNPIKTIHSETKPSGLAYSPNGEFLIAGTGTSPRNVNIYSVNRKYKKIQSFKKHKNLTMAVAFLDNATAISGGGNNKEIYIWDRASAEVKRKIEGVGDTVWSVGVDGDSIAWGNKWQGGDTHKGGTKLQKSLNLKNFQISENLKDKRFKRVSTTFGAYSLSHRAGEDYGDAILDIKKDDDTVSITRGSTNGLRHNCYGFYKNYIISGGANGFLKIYNRQGEEVADLVGHTGEVWSIALDGDRLVSGSDDQTIRIWDLSKLKSQMIPQLNIFVSKDNEWVVWSKSGYYNASIEGAKYVGYHINQGADKEAYYVSADKYSALYRPDIIEAIVKTGSEREGIALASKLKRVQKVEVANALPPMLSLLSLANFSTSKEAVSIKFAIKSEATVEKIMVTRNGVQINKKGLGNVVGEQTSVEVALEDGENVIAIRAKNRFALSDAIVVTVNKTSTRANIYKPTLYLVSIGVSEYQDSLYNLESAHKDATSISAMFAKQEGKIYKSVVAKTLINDDATSDNILDALDWLEQETTQRDVAIVFVSGHGVNDEKNNYYFLSHDSNSKKLRRTAVKWNEIKETIETLPSKRILLMDTCHSGNVMGSSRRKDVTSAIKSIVESGTGSIVMTASTGRGYSLEDSRWGHGAFTKALLEGIGGGKADYNHNGEISIKEIDLYVTERVKALTKGKQKPTTVIPESISDFALGVRN